MAKKKVRRKVSDVELIFKLMKRFDPSSVVREGEVATARNAPNVPARIRSRNNRALKARKASGRSRILTRFRSK